VYPVEAMDRFNVNTSLSKNWEHVNAKFVGSGHPDISRQCVGVRASGFSPPNAHRLLTRPPSALPRTPRSEWVAGHHRDTNATVLGHYDMLLYASTAEGAAAGRTRFSLLTKMVDPVGPPPAAAPAAALAKAVLAQRAGKEGGGGGGAQ
jgi:hypothetical protein